MTDEQLDRLGTFYNSEYVAKCQPWILEIPFEEWAQRQLPMKGGEYADRRAEGKDMQ